MHVLRQARRRVVAGAMARRRNGAERDAGALISYRTYESMYSVRSLGETASVVSITGIFSIVRASCCLRAPAMRVNMTMIFGRQCGTLGEISSWPARPLNEAASDSCCV